MPISDYAGLRDLVARWLNRDDLSGVIPDFIALAQARLNRDLRTRHMETTVALATEGGRGDVTLPGDFLEARGLVRQGSPVTALSYLTPAALAAAWPAGETGAPIHHTIIGDALHLGPVPDGVYTLSLTYYARIPALSDGEPVNWALREAPDAYLYASLLESAPFLMDDGRIQVWGGLYDTAIGRIQTADGRARWGSGPLSITVN